MVLLYIVKLGIKTDIFPRTMHSPLLCELCLPIKPFSTSGYKRCLVSQSNEKAHSLTPHSLPFLARLPLRSFFYFFLWSSLLWCALWPGWSFLTVNWIQPLCVWRRAGEIQAALQVRWKCSYTSPTHTRTPICLTILIRMFHSYHLLKQLINPMHISNAILNLDNQKEMLF